MAAWLCFRFLVNLFKARLDRFRANEDVKYDFTADLTGIGDISLSMKYVKCSLSQHNMLHRYSP